MAEAKQPKAAKAPKTNKVSVVAKFDKFVDLIANVEIGKEPVEVEMHPWLEAQVEAGLVIIV